MSEDRIVYRLSDDRVALMTPILGPDVSVQQVAEKDVPAEHPWRVIPVKDLPPFEKIDLWRWTEEGPLAVAEVVVEEVVITE